MRSCSIIIPCYNCEKTISRCVESLINQKCSFEYEIILIDDGSTDNTLNIIKSFNNKRIRIFQHENKGPAFTRLFGAKQAKFEKLIFVDSDDFVEKNYVACLLKNEEYIPFCLYNKIENEKILPQKDIKSGIYSKWDIIKKIMQSETRCTFWRMCFDKKKFFEIKMNNLHYCEDVLFIVEYILKSSKQIYVIKERIYNYNISNSNSLSNNFYDENNLRSFIQFPFEIKKVFDRYIIPFSVDKYINRELCFSIIRVFRIVDYKSFKQIFLSEEYLMFKKLKFTCFGNSYFKFYLYAFRTKQLFLIYIVERTLKRKKDNLKKIKFYEKMENVLNEENCNNDNER